MGPWMDPPYQGRAVPCSCRARCACEVVREVSRGGRHTRALRRQSRHPARLLARDAGQVVGQRNDAGRIQTIAPDYGTRVEQQVVQQKIAENQFDVGIGGEGSEDTCVLGFQKGCQRAECVGAIRNSIGSCTEWDIPLYICQFDAPRMYDSVKHEAVWNAMYRRGAPVPVITMYIQDMRSAEVVFTYAWKMANAPPLYP